MKMTRKHPSLIRLLLITRKFYLTNCWHFHRHIFSSTLRKKAKMTIPKTPVKPIKTSPPTTVKQASPEFDSVIVVSDTEKVVEYVVLLSYIKSPLIYKLSASTLNRTLQSRQNRVAGDTFGFQTPRAQPTRNHERKLWMRMSVLSRKKTKITTKR